MTKSLQGKVALVSGAGSVDNGWGNGKATAVTFAREGARVFAVDRNFRYAKETVDIIRSEGLEASAHEADVSKSKDVAGMCQECVSTYGSIDILHNNVGIGALGDPITTTQKEWNHVLNTNITSMFLSCKHALPFMIKQGHGAIVNVSSLSATRAIRPEIAYATSKGAVNAFTINVALTYADQGIRCNGVVPGLINTPMVSQYLRSDHSNGDIEKIMRQRDKLSPTGKMGVAWDIANAATFLASDKSDYINGVLLYVDAGLHQKFTTTNT